jgi:hypothetical protein
MHSFGVGNYIPHALVEHPERGLVTHSFRFISDEELARLEALVPESALTRLQEGVHSPGEFAAALAKYMGPVKAGKALYPAKVKARRS